jgi:hypothetical protein
VCAAGVAVWILVLAHAAEPERIPFGADIRFQAVNARATEHLLFKKQDSAHVYFSPEQDAELSVGIHGATLRSRAHAQGRRYKTYGPGMQAAFSVDGRRAAIIQASGPLMLIKIPSGDLERSIDERPAAVAFASSSIVYYHTGGFAPDWRGRLMKADLSTKDPPKGIGPELNVNGVWSTVDGKTWFVHDETKPGALYRLDAQSGLGTLIFAGKDEDRIETPIVVSPQGDRVCFTWQKELACLHTADGVLERLGPGGTDYMSLAFEDTGRHLLFSRSETDDQASYRTVFCVVDFSTKEVHRLVGAAAQTGGNMALLSGARYFVTGGSRAVNVYDLLQGTSFRVPGSSPYSVALVPRQSARMVVSHEYGGGIGEDVYLVELPR